MKKIILLVFAFITLATVTNCGDTETQFKDAKRILGWKSHAALGCAKTMALFAPLFILEHKTCKIINESIDRLPNLFIATQLCCFAMVAHSIYSSFKKSHKLYKKTH